MTRSDGREREEPRLRGSLRVLRPLPVALMVYALLLAVGQIWNQGVLEHGELEELQQREWLGLRLPVLLGVVHVAWAVLMLFELWRARRSPVGLRRGHLAGAAVGLALALALCWWSWRFATAEA